MTIKKDEEYGPTKFVCNACGNSWAGLYIPLCCPRCEVTHQIAIDIGEEEE